MKMTHQYISRSQGTIVDERLFGDFIVRFLYSKTRERVPWLFRALTGPRTTHLLALLNFDLPLSARLLGNQRFLKKCGVRLEECLDSPEMLTTARKIFERKIRYWECRPMDQDPSKVVSPADSRVLIGSLAEASALFLKGKFFEYEELLSPSRPEWLTTFRHGDFAISRLTPDKYHYNHFPVSGNIVEIYGVDGCYHACNPAAIAKIGTPFSKNKRVVTIIDTDVEGGTQVGRVAMIEVVALMIGDIVQCYSSNKYDDPVDVVPGIFVERGAPKSLYRPGSSTTILLFEKDQVTFSPDILSNQQNKTCRSRFTPLLDKAIIETDVCLRSPLATRSTKG